MAVIKRPCLEMAPWYVNLFVVGFLISLFSYRLVDARCIEVMASCLVKRSVCSNERKNSDSYSIFSQELFCRILKQNVETKI